MSTSYPAFDAYWPQGKGEMARLVRAHDWSATPLGPIHGWPDRLRGVVELVLASPLVATLALLGERLLIYNDAAAALYGDRHPAALGRSLAATFPEAFPAVAHLYDRVFAGEAVAVAAQPLSIAGGDQVFDAYLIPVRDGAGAVIGAHMTGFEVGDRLRIAQALRESEEQQRLVVELVPALLWWADPTGREISLNHRWKAFTAQSDAETHDYGWLDAIHPDDVPATRTAFEHAFATGEPIERQQRVRKAGGGYRWHLVRHVPLRDESGAITRWFGAAIDIHDLRESQARQLVLVAELQHRVRNILTIIRSVFGRTVETGSDLEEVADHFRGRLDSLARTQVVSTQSHGGLVDLENLIRDELLSVGPIEEDRLVIEGPDVGLPPATAESIGLAIHELTTNALKYGVLKTPSGNLEIRWDIIIEHSGERLLHLNWTEQGVPAIPLSPTRKGFGTELITEALPYRLGAETSLTFRSGGVRCSISVPLPDEGAFAVPAWKDF